MFTRMAKAIYLHSCNISLQLPLLTRQRCGLGLKFIHSVVGLGQFHLGGLAGSIRGFELCPQFLYFTSDHVAASLGHVVLFTGIIALALFILDLRLLLL